MPSSLIISGGGSGSGGSGGGNASVGVNGNAAPTSSTEIGFVVSGLLQPVSVANPLPITGTVTESNASIGVIGSPAPTSATLLGVINGSGNLVGVSASNPIRIDPTGTTVQPVSGSVSVSNFPATQPISGSVSIIGTVPVSGTLAVTQGTTPWADNISQWGGAVVSAANTAALGTETAPVVRPLQVKNCSILTTTSLAANGVFTSASGSGPSGWFDSAVTGDTFVSAKSLSNVASAASGFVIQMSDDPTNAGLTQSLAFGSTGANSIFTLNTVINSRYWRIVYTNGATIQASFELSVVSGPFGVGLLGQGQSQSAGFSNNLTPVNAIQNNVVADGSTSNGFVNNAGVVSAVQMVNGFLTGNPSSGANYTAARTPNIFKGGQGGSSAGAFSVWQPQLAKKARAMKYQIEIAEDAAITSGAPVNIGFRFGLPRSLAATFVGARTMMFDYTHRVLIPSAAIATSFDGYVSGWIDLGNGVIGNDVAGRSLFCGLMVPAPASPVTPAWTLATTGQWEAGCVAFTTAGNKGIFRLVQYSASSSAVATVSTGALGFGRGNLIVVIVRSTNIAAGAPTNTVLDNAGNTFTPLTIITNASDGANGSSLQLFYNVSMAGTDALLGLDVITNTASVHVPSAQAIIVLEYENTGAIDASAQTTGTGNSTAPAAGAYTPTSVGDLILSYAATSTGQATCPQLNSPFFGVAEQGGTAAACLMVGDNWGNGALTAGLVNVVVVGTEE